MRGHDLLDGVEGAAGWLVERGLLDGNVGLTEEGRLRLLEFREGLRRILLGHNGGPVGEGASVLNEAAEDALLRVRFDGGGAPGLLPAGAGSAVGGGGRPPARRGGRCFFRGDLAAAQGLPQRGVPVGVLRRVQEPLW